MVVGAFTLGWPQIKKPIIIIQNLEIHLQLPLEYWKYIIEHIN